MNQTIQIKKFRTPQEMKSLSVPKGNDSIIGLDIGYGGTKVFFENGFICFPSYAKQLDGDVLMSDPRDILYKDLETNEVYMVGRSAQEMITSTDTNDTDAELFSRKRYNDERFRVLCNTAIGLAARGKKQIVIQSSLPASYVEADSGQLKKTLLSSHPFALKTGSEKWKEFCFDEQKVAEPLAQPMAALYSAITKPDGRFVHSDDPDRPDAKRLLTRGTLVIDIGFETLDLYGIQSRRKICNDSIDYLGMRAVLENARKSILSDTGEDIRISEMQKYLSTGTFVVTDEDTMQAEVKQIAPYIIRANKEILEKAKNKIKSATASFRGYENVVISGGTGAAWYGDLCEWLSKMQMHIYPSDINDRLGMHLSIARGDYMYRYAGGD